MGSLDTIHALGESEKVVGVPQKNLPSYLSEFENVSSVGGLKEPDLEKINQLKPDLIIISRSSRRLSRNSFRLLHRHCTLL